MTDCVWELNETHMYGENQPEVYVVDQTNGFNGEWIDGK